MSDRTRLTTKGQVVIPTEVRKALRWRPGLALRVSVLNDGGVTLRPQRQQVDELIDELSGCLGGEGALRALEGEHRAEVRADERRRQRRP